MTYSKPTFRTALTVSTVLLIGLAGCRAEEQNRPQSFTPGVYQGQQDAALDPAVRNGLRNRVNRQRAP